jgi:hypothetical protein
VQIKALCDYQTKLISLVHAHTFDFVFKDDVLELCVQRFSDRDQTALLELFFSSVVLHQHHTDEQEYKSLSLACTEHHHESLLIALGDPLAYFRSNIHLVGFWRVKTFLFLLLLKIV